MTTLNFGVIIISNASVCSTSGSNNVCQRQRRLLPKDSFIHSGYVYCASSSRPTLLFRGALDYSIDIVLELTCLSATVSGCVLVTVSEGLAKGPLVAAGVGLKPATFRTQDIEPTSEPPRLTSMSLRPWMIIIDRRGVFYNTCDSSLELHHKSVKALPFITKRKITHCSIGWMRIRGV